MSGIREYIDDLGVKVVNVIGKVMVLGVDVLLPTYTSGRNMQIKNVADPTDPQDAVNLQTLEGATGGPAVKKVNTVDPVGGNVTIDLQSVVNQGAVSTLDISVPEEAYSEFWNTAEVPTKKDVRVEMEKRVEKVEDHSLVPDSEIAKLATLSGSYRVGLPAGATVAQRIATPTYLPSGWALAAGTSPVDLLITHGLNKRVAHVKVVAITGTEEQALFNTAEFNGWRTPDVNSLLIGALATVNKPINIYIQTI